MEEEEEEEEEEKVNSVQQYAYHCWHYLIRMLLTYKLYYVKCARLEATVI